MSEFAAVLAAVKGKSLRDGLRPPLTAASRSAPAKSGRDEEMSQARSNKEMQLTTPLTAIAPYKSIDVKLPFKIASVGVSIGRMACLEGPPREGPESPAIPFRVAK